MFVLLSESLKRAIIQQSHCTCKRDDNGVCSDAAGNGDEDFNDGDGRFIAMVIVVAMVILAMVMVLVEMVVLVTVVVVMLVMAICCWC